MRTVPLLCSAVLVAACGVDSRTSLDPRISSPALQSEQARDNAEPTLMARAILPATAYQQGPASGLFITGDNGVVPPFPGQPIPGFSAVLNIGDGTFWAMPDNGFGAKDNSGDFLLRLYHVRPDFKTARGGSGVISVIDFIQLRDPDNKIPFGLFRPDRLLTGADFDLESVRRTNDGTFWFGEEFGPFILHVDATGKVLEAPISLPGVMSPQNPFLPNPDAWTLRASRGFEGMALSKDGKTLYPAIEGALRNDPDPRRRILNEFDIRSRQYTGRTWQYHVDVDFPDALIGDLTALDEHRFVLIERDDFQGVEARQKKIYLIDLRRVGADGFLEKRLVLNLLHIGDPQHVSLPARPGEFGVGDPFSFPLQSVESLEVLDDERLLIANDNNFPFSDGRWIARDRPDDTEMIIVRVPAMRPIGPRG
jgi:glycerophosphoryl diester phosphodiesterase